MNITFQFFLFSRFATDTDVQQEVGTLQIARRQTSDFVVQGTHRISTRITFFITLGVYFIINYRNNY